MKLCPKCGKTKPLSEFKKNGKRPPYRCKVCVRKYYTRISSSRRRALVEELKSVPCTDCGAQYPPWVMDFDHVDGTKVMDVSAMVWSTLSEARLREEIAKCEVVCANCHRQRTHERQ